MAAVFVVPNNSQMVGVFVVPSAFPITCAFEVPGLTSVIAVINKV